jgi:hypothetical protein
MQEVLDDADGELVGEGTIAAGGLLYLVTRAEGIRRPERQSPAVEFRQSMIAGDAHRKL